MEYMNLDALAHLRAAGESPVPPGATTIPGDLTAEEVAELLEATEGSGSQSSPLSAIGEQLRRGLDLSFFFGGSVTLNPEMVLAMTRSRLRDLDNQLHMNMKKLNDSTELSQDLAARQEALQEVRAALDEVTENGDDQKPLSEVIMPDGRNAEAYLASHGITDVSGSQSTGSLDSHIEVVKTESRKINSGNEMLMLTIQTLTQQRSQVLQLGTSLIKKIHEGEQSVAGNIGR